MRKPYLLSGIAVVLFALAGVMSITAAAHAAQATPAMAVIRPLDANRATSRPISSSTGDDAIGAVNQRYHRPTATAKPTATECPPDEATATAIPPTGTAEATP